MLSVFFFSTHSYKLQGFFKQSHVYGADRAGPLMREREGQQKLPTSLHILQRAKHSRKDQVEVLVCIAKGSKERMV